MNKMNYLHLGAFEADADNYIAELLKEVLPYYRRYTKDNYEDRMFNALIDYMDENPLSWLWDNIDQSVYDGVDAVNDMLKRLSKSLVDELFIVRKNIYNSRGEKIEEKVKPLIKDKFEEVVWQSDKSYRNDYGLLIRYTNDYRIALKTLTINGLIMSVKHFKLFCKDLSISLDTLTPQHLQKLITDYEMDKSNPIWKKYSTLQTFKESLLTELNIKTDNKNEVLEKYVVGRGYIRYSKNDDIDSVFHTDSKRNFKDLDETLDVFDF